MDPVFYLRFLERLLAVSIGGLCIYLGYRLFHDIPKHRDSSGTLHLPWNISIVMTRVGPGAFFALFGAVAICLALFLPLKNMESTRPAQEDAAETKPSPAPSSSRVVEQSWAGGLSLTDEERDDRKDARKNLEDPISALNALPGKLRKDLSPAERKDVLQDLAEVKVRLMRPVWGTPEEGFGPLIDFEQWAVGRAEQGAPPQGMEGAVALYRYQQQPPAPVGRRAPPEARP